MLRFGRLEIDLGARDVRVDGKPATSPATSSTCWSCCAERAGRVLTRDQIMDALKGHQLEAFDRSIDVHISRIRARSRTIPKNPQRVLTVRGAGYVFAKQQD